MITVTVDIDGTKYVGEYDNDSNPTGIGQAVTNTLLNALNPWAMVPVKQLVPEDADTGTTA